MLFLLKALICYHNKWINEYYGIFFNKICIFAWES